MTDAALALALPVSDVERLRLVAMLRALTGSALDAEDLAQEALLRAWRARERFEPGRSTWAWVKAIARNLAVDLLRQRQARPRAISLEHACAEGASEPAARVSESALESAQAARTARLVMALRAALVELPDRERQAFCLFYEDGLAIAQIAVRLGAPTGTVKSWLHRARERLRSRIGSADGASGAEGADADEMP